MLQFKLQKRLYFLTLLVGLISYSGIANTIPVEKARVEIQLVKTSNDQKFYDYVIELIKNQKSTLKMYFSHNIDCLLNNEKQLQVSTYNNYKLKFIPLKRVQLLLKLQYYSSFMDCSSIS